MFSENGNSVTTLSNLFLCLTTITLKEYVFLCVQFEFSVIAYPTVSSQCREESDSIFTPFH